MTLVEGWVFRKVLCGFWFDTLLRSTEGFLVSLALLFLFWYVTHMISVPLISSFFPIDVMIPL